MTRTAAHVPLAEFPLPPFPPTPPVVPPAPPAVQVHPPMVYVEPAWEYRQLTRPLSGGAPDAELDALGAEGWELVSVLPVGADARFYFKRQLR